MEPVVFAVLAKQKAHALPLYLDCLLKQTFPLQYVHLYIRANDSTDHTDVLLDQFVCTHGDKFASVKIDLSSIDAALGDFGQHEWNTFRFAVLGRLRQQSVDYAKTLGAHYFVVDCDNFITPTVLQDMYDVRHLNAVVAPMLNSATLYSNFHEKVDANGYMELTDAYKYIYSREVCGLLKVPVVHCTYFIPNSVLSNVSYDDGSARYEYVIFSDTLRKQNIPQYLDNRKWYGFVTFAENSHDLKRDYEALFQHEFGYVFKTIVVSPTTACLGNRLRALCGALAFADAYGYNVQYVDYDGTFERYFKPHPRLTRALTDTAIDAAYSEWMPGSYWFHAQSAAISAFKIPHDAIHHASLEAMVQNTHKTILLETSLTYMPPSHETYKRYFVPRIEDFSVPKGIIGVAANVDPRFMMYFPETQHLRERYLRIISEHDQVFVYSNSPEFQHTMQAANKQLPLVQHDSFISFLWLSKCQKVYGTPMWAFAYEAAVFGGIPFISIDAQLRLGADTIA